ncbi:hypothetical protein OOK36_52285 [Streptomyces sp. NBC_00365]|nr:hypothetical protein [Streptomyces sp. NBC_00365]MCX5097120.1 hypothetical protein [Streptomyces sp. NBC_00365]
MRDEDPGVLADLVGHAGQCLRAEVGVGEVAVDLLQVEHHRSQRESGNEP